MSTITWRRIGTGVYQSGSGAFSVRFNNSAGQWMLLQRDDDAGSGWTWCQSYALLRDAKLGARWIADRALSDA